MLAASFGPWRQEYTPAAYLATVVSVDGLRDRWSEGPTWVAHAASRIVGTIGAVPRADGVYVRTMAVHPDARGHRLGSRLLDSVFQYAKAQKAARLYLSTTPFLVTAIGLYKTAGFVEISAPPYDLHGNPLVSMECRLKS